MPKISIGITTFNRSIFLKKALESIANQHYRNIEVIVGNDYIHEKITINQLPSFDFPIKVFNHKSNLGELDNLKFLLSAASGEYFFWLADDDLLMDDALKHIKKTIKLYPQNEFIVPSSISNLKNKEKRNKETNINLYHKQDFLNDFLIQKIRFQGVYIVYKTNFIRKIIRINKTDKNIYYADYDLIFKSLIEMNKDSIIPFIENPCFFFRIHNGSESNTTSDYKSFLLGQKRLLETFTLLIENDNSINSKQIINLFKFHLIPNFVHILVRANHFSLYKYIKLLDNFSVSKIKFKLLIRLEIIFLYFKSYFFLLRSYLSKCIK